MSDLGQLKKTPLFDLHNELHGKLIDFGGWALPVQYSSILEEHKAVRERAGLFDVSHMGEAMVTGEGAVAYLNHILTNDVTSMTPGGCRYSPMCYKDGGTVDDVLVYKFADDRFMLVINAGNTDKDIVWMQGNLTNDAAVENVSASVAQLALQGPAFLDVLSAAGCGELPAKYYRFVEHTTVAGRPCLVSRTGYTGETGVEIYCAAADGEAIARALLEAGRPLGLLPCGLGARDTLRFEAGMPLYGHELTQDITPLEAGLDFAIKLKKEEFIGRDALLAPPSRQRIGLRLTDRGIARDGAEVFCGEARVGRVTSGMVAPSAGANFAMALVDTDFADKTDYTIDVRGRRLAAVRAEMPFNKK